MLDNQYLDRVEQALTRADRRISRAIDSGDYDELQKALEKSGGRDPGRRRVLNPGIPSEEVGGRSLGLVVCVRADVSAFIPATGTDIGGEELRGGVRRSSSAVSFSWQADLYQEPCRAAGRGGGLEVEFEAVPGCPAGGNLSIKGSGETPIEGGTAVLTDANGTATVTFDSENSATVVAGSDSDAECTYTFENVTPGR